MMCQQQKRLLIATRETKKNASSCRNNEHIIINDEDNMLVNTVSKDLKQENKIIFEKLIAIDRQE